jgi:hypothetical protein
MWVKIIPGRMVADSQAENANPGKMQLPPKVLKLMKPYRLERNSLPERD